MNNKVNEYLCGWFDEMLSEIYEEEIKNEVHIHNDDDGGDEHTVDDNEEKDKASNKKELILSSLGNICALLYYDHDLDTAHNSVAKTQLQFCISNNSSDHNYIGTALHNLMNIHTDTGEVFVKVEETLNSILCYI